MVGSVRLREQGRRRVGLWLTPGTSRIFAVSAFYTMRLGSSYAMRLGSRLTGQWPAPAHVVWAVYTATMSAFWHEEAMGANRLESAAQQNMLLNAGQDDSAYNDFFGNRPEGGGEVLPGQDDDDGYHTARDLGSEVGHVESRDGGGSVIGGGGGLIEEEQPEQAPASGGVLARAGRAAPLIERRPSIDYSTETNPVEPWMPRSRNPQRAGQARSNNVLGKYWRTFGERSSAIGGGVGGFFGALFGGGMKRANAIAGARARRAVERGGPTDRAAAPRGGGMRSRLENEGSAQADDIRNYPVEPGVKVDRGAALKARKAYNTAFSAFDLIDRPSHADARGLSNVHAEYDLSTGSRTQPLDAETYKHTPDKFTAINKANDEWGDAAAAEEINAHAPKPRLRNAQGVEKRVGFMDGANDEAEPAPNDPSEIDPKPRPTGVRFHPVPMITASREGMNWRQRRATGARERANALTDDGAVAQEQMTWPIRNRLSRMGADQFELTGMNAAMRAHMMQQENPAADGPEADQMRELHITGELAGDISSKREQEANSRAERQRSAFPTRGLNKFQQMTVMQELIGSGDRRWKDLDQTKYLEGQMDQVPARYFKNRYWNAFDARTRQEEPRSDSVVGENAGDAGNEAQGVVGDGAGAGGIIEEESA